MSKFGLIGKQIDYSFSKQYFREKFENESLKHTYENFDIDSISHFPNILSETQDLRGLNVTIPYKESIIPFLDKLSKKAHSIGAVNTIKISKKGKLTGYNTDYYGFKKSLEPLLLPHHKKALILGTGGASKAVAYALEKLDIPFQYVSRKAQNMASYSYNMLTEHIIDNHQVIINCTPLGTYPNIDESPSIPYQFISSNHLLFDLIYNPSETRFLKEGNRRGATVINGLKMLELQAEKAWKIWQ